MTIRHMKIFLRVVQTQNITRAAEALHMTQPAVTRAIQEIENYYGVYLFERMNRRLSVTESGKQLYAQALHIVESFDEMEKGLRNWDAVGVLRLGSSITLGNFFMPEMVKHLQEKWPNLQIQVTVANVSDLQRALLDNRLDIAVTEGGITEPDLHIEFFGDDQLILIFPPQHPLALQQEITMEDLAAYPFLLREKGSSVRAYLESVFSLHNMAVRPAWESVSTQALVRAASCGLGISILPARLVQRDIDAGSVCTRAVTGENFSRQYCLVWHKNKHLTKSMADFVQICKTQTAVGTAEKKTAAK